MIQRPEAHEYAPFYAGYIQLVAEGDLLQLLESQQAATIKLLSGIAEDKAGYRYAPGKWSLKEVLGHMLDTERIMSYRALSFARGEQGQLPGFDQDEYVGHAGFDARPLESLLAEYATVRQATLSLLRSFSDEAWSRRGIMNNNRVTVRALGYVIAGHELHHLNVIRSHYLQN